MKAKRAANSVLQGTIALQVLMTQPGFAQQGIIAQDGNVVTLGNSTFTTACPSPTTNPCTNNQLERGIMSAILAPIPTQSYTASVGGVGALVQQGTGSAVLHVCGSYTSLSMSVATTLQVIAASSGKTIYICDYEVYNGVTSTTTLTWQIGTGTNCASGLAQLGAALYPGTNWGKIAANAFYRGLNTGAVGSSALCVKSTVTTTFDVGVYYDQY